MIESAIDRHEPGIALRVAGGVDDTLVEAYSGEPVGIGSAVTDRNDGSRTGAASEGGDRAPRKGRGLHDEIVGC